MTLVRVKRRPALLTLAIAVGSLAATWLAAPAFAEGSAPAASYMLDFTNLWPGQAVTLTESDLRDDDTGTDDLTRTVWWGDGSPPEVIPVATSQWAHIYQESGTFAVTVDIAEPDGTTGKGSFATTNIVTVSEVPGTFKLNRKTAYWGTANQHVGTPEKFDQLVTVTISGLTPEVIGGRVNWGDGAETDFSPTSISVSHRYLFGEEASHSVYLWLSNASGEILPRYLGLVTVKEDTFRPTMSVTTPKNPTKVSSWATVKGTLGDKGLGVYKFGLMFVEKRGKSWYYYQDLRWWRANTKDDALDYAQRFFVKPGSNKWSMKLAGLAKGTLVIGYNAIDKNDNLAAPDTVYKIQKLSA